MIGPRDIAGAADWIQSLQGADGAIGFLEGGLWNPWSQTECALGLIAAGRLDAARRALAHLAATQEADGGWTHDLGAAAPLDSANRRLIAAAPRLRESNFAAWTATGALAMARAGGADDLERFGPMALRACDFALTMQRPDGAFVWAEGADDALLAANCAIFKALDCAVRLAGLLGRDAARWRDARAALGAALRGVLTDGAAAGGAAADRFAPKPAHAMDWYYPVLSGVLTDDAARARLAARWGEFVGPDGCRCISDQPWATAAETAELAIACHAAGDGDAARAMLAAAWRMQDAGGGLWMGRQFALGLWWPQERPPWTAAAALIAADAVLGLSPAATLFAPD